ncbi:hypothetical protein [Senegalia massiliensis]|uniref:Uncharacterized protein n=1 Tax=Senegalia massiliensis TaxID=1720316 RepID=A0A845R1C8_9CLOT|nr:hypothetical protein [Senegalia massiliensis]NBI07526.1 hypothetical protein [Senegalia massiliensis]
MDKKKRDSLDDTIEKLERIKILYSVVRVPIYILVVVLLLSSIFTNNRLHLFMLLTIVGLDFVIKNRIKIFKTLTY